MTQLRAPNHFLKATTAYTFFAACAWTVINVKACLHHKPEVFLFNELFEQLDLTLVIFLVIFNFAPQIFSLCLVNLFTFFAEYRRGALMARASAAAASWTFGPFAWMILNYMQTYETLSTKPGTIHSVLCAPGGDDRWCYFTRAAAHLSVALLVPQALLTVYNVALYLRAVFRSPRRLDAAQRVSLAVLAVVASGYAMWAIGSARIYHLRTLDLDPIRLLMSPFLAISAFLVLVFGMLMVYETSRELVLLTFGFSGLGIFGFSSGIVYHWRRLSEEDYAIFGVTPCATENPVAEAVFGPVPDGVCHWERVIVWGLTLMLAGMVVMACLTLGQFLGRKKWRASTFGAEDADSIERTGRETGPEDDQAAAAAAAAGGVAATGGRYGAVGGGAVVAANGAGDQREFAMVAPTAEGAYTPLLY